MAKPSLDFKSFLDYAERLDNLGREHLKKAVENALIKSKEYANNSILEAMDNSDFAFKRNEQSDRGVGLIASGKGKNRRATGKAIESTKEVAKLSVTWEGNTAIAYIGPDLQESPEALMLALGTPHIYGDRNLNNALKVKGKYRKEVSKIQFEEFKKVLEEAQNDKHI